MRISFEDSRLLFGKQYLNALLRAHEQKMLEAINEIEPNRLLNTSMEDWCDYFEHEYTVDAPRLKEDEITVDQTEAQVDVSHDIDRATFDRSKPFYLKGTAVSFFIPFEGDPELFKYQPSTFTYNPPRADVRENELVLTYTRTDHNAMAMKSEFEHELSEIRSYLDWVRRDVSTFNASIRTKAQSHIESRRQKLLNDQGMVANLGFPLKRRDNAPQTFVTPTVRRKMPVPAPAAGVAPFVPEPVLDMQEYEHILSVISNMVAVMERSPQAFRGMSEENLRQHFLVQLNGHYEGQATGETFNFDGKTDILIRVEGKNIFIAECKFWHGPKAFGEALDQLLGYATWRDTKTALLLFNRGKSLSVVLSKIPEVVGAHPNFRRKLPYSSETGFRFVLHHRDDTSRELILAVLVFEVPE